MKLPHETIILKPAANGPKILIPCRRIAIHAESDSARFIVLALGVDKDQAQKFLLLIAILRDNISRLLDRD
jgi:hypothetical protein